MVDSTHILCVCECVVVAERPHRVDVYVVHMLDGGNRQFQIELSRKSFYRQQIIRQHHRQTKVCKIRHSKAVHDAIVNIQNRKLSFIYHSFGEEKKKTSKKFVKSRNRIVGDGHADDDEDTDDTVRGDFDAIEKFSLQHITS